jgi:hypothetical protein
MILPPTILEKAYRSRRRFGRILVRPSVRPLNGSSIREIR